MRNFKSKEVSPRKACWYSSLIMLYRESYDSSTGIKAFNFCCVTLDLKWTKEMKKPRQVTHILKRLAFARESFENED
jgi:hypothetical protein